MMKTHPKTHPWMKLCLFVVIPVASLLPAAPGEAIEVEQVLAAVKTAYTLYQEFLDHGTTLEQATADIINAVNTAKAEILTQINAIAAAQAKSCAKAVIISYESIGEFTEDVTQQFANDSIACLTEIESLLNLFAVGKDQVNSDILGVTLNALGPVVLLVDAYAQFDRSAAILDLVESGNQVVIGTIVPYCWQYTIPGDSNPEEIVINCTAYNGDKGFGSSYVGDPNLQKRRQEAERYAYRNTSRRIAESVDLPL
jgi:hypothetical protein